MFVHELLHLLIVIGVENVCRLAMYYLKHIKADKVGVGMLVSKLVDLSA